MRGRPLWNPPRPPNWWATRSRATLPAQFSVASPPSSLSFSAAALLPHPWEHPGSIERTGNAIHVPVPPLGTPALNWTHGERLPCSSPPRWEHPGSIEHTGNAFHAPVPPMGNTGAQWNAWGTPSDCANRHKNTSELFFLCVNMVFSYAIFTPRVPVQFHLAECIDLAHNAIPLVKCTGMSQVEKACNVTDVACFYPWSQCPYTT